MRILEVKEPYDRHRGERIARDRAVRSWELSRWGEHKVTPGADPLRHYFSRMFDDTFASFPTEIQNYEANNHAIGAGASILDGSRDADERFEHFIVDNSPEGWHDHMMNWAGWLTKLKNELSFLSQQMTDFNKKYGGGHKKIQNADKFLKDFKNVKGVVVTAGRGKDELFRFMPDHRMEEVNMRHEGKETQYRSFPLSKVWQLLKAQDEGWVGILQSNPNWMKIKTVPGNELRPEDYDLWGLDLVQKRETVEQKARETARELSPLLPEARIKRTEKHYHLMSGKRMITIESIHERPGGDWQKTGIDIWVRFPDVDEDWAQLVKNKVEQLGFNYRGREERRGPSSHKIHEDLYEIDL